MQLTLILNSARAGTPAIVERVSEACRANAVELHVETSPGSMLAAGARHAVAQGSTVVVAGGGDGTVSTVASAVAGTGATLGVLPLGTLNHFARDMGIPRNLDQAIAAILSRHTVMVDVGEVNGHLFINNASVGLYPRLVWEREHREREGHHKMAAAIAAAVTVWRRYRRVTVLMRTGNGRPTPVRTPFVFVGNNVYELSGLRFGSRQRLDEGRLHVCMAPELSAAGVAGALGAMLVGRLGNFERFESLEAADLTITARRHRLGIALDGEVMILPVPLRFSIRTAALRVAVPPPER